MAHTTIARPAQHEEIVRGSRFLALVAPARSVADGQALLVRARRDHPDASHHCSAWRIGAEMAGSDDGEPGGTAGRPMLNVLLMRDLDHVATVCVRWFGGTKLGAGGLVRAYSGTVAKALDAAGTRTVHDVVSGVVRAPFEHADAIHRLLSGWRHLEGGTPSYDADGARIRVRIRADDGEAFAEAVRDATAGDAAFLPDGASDEAAGPTDDG